MHDLVLKGGRVIDPANGLDAQADVAFTGGRVAAVGQGLTGRQVQDVSGLIVTPGLIDVNPNTMYPLLRSLEEQGLVTGEWEHPERRSRRFYAITPEGEKERERLAAVVTPRLGEVADSLERLRSELS